MFSATQILHLIILATTSRQHSFRLVPPQVSNTYYLIHVWGRTSFTNDYGECHISNTPWENSTVLKNVAVKIFKEELEQAKNET